jgi:hypothetical protein
MIRPKKSKDGLFQTQNSFTVAGAVPGLSAMIARWTHQLPVSSPGKFRETPEALELHARAQYMNRQQMCQ